MAVMVSYGSYKPLLLTLIGTTTWILECSATQASCFGECSTLGLHNEVNPYQSEIQGCHVGLLGLLAFTTYHQIQGRKVDFHIDNAAHLNQSAAGHLNVAMHEVETR
jgi:hypothetical protein